MKDTKSQFAGKFIKNLEVTNMRKGHSVPLLAQSITVSAVAPKVFKYVQPSGGLGKDMAIESLVSDVTRQTVVDALKNMQFVTSVLTEVTGARSGVFKTDVVLISLDSLRNTIAETLTSTGIRSNQRVIMVLTGFFMELLAPLGVVTKTGSIELLDLKKNFFITAGDVVDEMKKVKISYALDMFDMSKIEKKKDIGVAAVVSEITSQAYAMEISLLGVDNCASELDTVLTLIRCYVLKEFEVISDDEQTFFENEKFIQLAHNLSFSRMALMVNKKRPRASYHFWMQALERVDSAMKSSSLYTTMEIAALKEHYTLSIVRDSDGLKKGFVVNQNLAETKPLQVFYRLNDTLSQADNFWRLHEDVTTARQISDSYSQASKLSMSDVHNYTVAMLSKFTKAEDELFCANFNLGHDELVMLAASFGAKLEILNGTDNESFIFPVIVFRLDTTNSQIRTPLPNFVGTMKTEDPLVALLVEADDFVGKKIVSDNSKTIEEPKGKVYVKLAEFMSNRITQDLNITLYSTIGTIRLKERMGELLSTKDLSRTQCTTPVIGNLIYTYLFQIFNDLTDFESFVSPKNQKKSYGVPAAIAFSNMFKPVITSQDLVDMTYVAKGLIWDHLIKTGKTSAEGRSILSDKRVESELSMLLGIEMLDKLGFLTDEKLKQKAISVLKEAQVYDLI